MTPWYILDTLTKWLNKVLIVIAGIVLVFMVFLVSTNIVLRFFWQPIRGTFEIMGFCGALIAAFALGYTQIKRGHIAVNILVTSFPKSLQRAIECTNNILCMFFFLIAAWQLTDWSTNLWVSSEVTESLGIVYFPFSYSIALGCVCIALVFLLEIFKTFIPRGGNKK